jgi:hypothetical protein
MLAIQESQAWLKTIGTGSAVRTRDSIALPVESKDYSSAGASSPFILGALACRFDKEFAASFFMRAVPETGDFN